MVSDVKIHQISNYRQASQQYSTCVWYAQKISRQGGLLSSLSESLFASPKSLLSCRRLFITVEDSSKTFTTSSLLNFLHGIVPQYCTIDHEYAITTTRLVSIKYVKNNFSLSFLHSVAISTQAISTPYQVKAAQRYVHRAGVHILSDVRRTS